MMPPPPYHITIRFSTAYPDLDLDISSPQTTTIVSLKNLIRTRLATRSRLRFIYHGRLLPDNAALSSVIKPPPLPPPAPSSSTSIPFPSLKKDSKAEKDKGKGKATDGGAGGLGAVRIYINCSIGDELAPQELAAEKEAAENPPHETGPFTLGGAASPTPGRRQQARPRGFDRLLNAGFTSSEISTLRTQFASIQAERFARDALPSPDTMRALEDSWIDSNAGEQIPAAGQGAGPLIEDDLSSMASMLDVLVRGMMIGFFFPLGSMAWLLRSDLWNEKWQICVGAGVMMSLVVGSLMSLFGTR